MQKEKQILRERILTLLRNQKEEDRLNKSLVIFDKLLNMLEFRNALTILFYASFDGEVYTFEMMKQAQKLGKEIGLPRFTKEEKQIIPVRVANPDKDLEPGPYGIMQPKASRAQTLSLEEIDMVIVPGVAFDKENNRLGRGGGYYDRFLKIIPRDIPSIGLAFDFQLVDRIPRQDAQDVPVSHVLVN